jgi:hypothetical protein
VAPNSPINDSGVLNPPVPGPSGFPVGPITFTQSGTYYYRCRVHPATMRGRVVVEPNTAVGGNVELLLVGDAGSSFTLIALGGIAALAIAGSGGVLAAKRLRNRSDPD